MKDRPARPFFDTSILIYTVSDDPRAEQAEALLADGGHISVQVLNEFVAVARRKLNMDWDTITAATEAIRALCPPAAAIDVALHEQGLEIAARYGYHIYDSLIIAAALHEQCDILYTEDMHHNQKIGPLTLRNPFKPIADGKRR